MNIEKNLLADVKPAPATTPAPAPESLTVDRVKAARALVLGAFTALTDEEMEKKMDLGRKAKAAAFTADAKGTVDRYLQSKGASEVGRLVKADLDQAFSAWSAAALKKRGK
jgi:hypothetical protein